MPVLVDDTPLTPAAATLTEALAAARSMAESQRRVITEVLLDGRPVPDSALAGSPQSHPLAPDAVVRFLTADPIDLVQASLRDAAAAIAQLDALQLSAASNIQSGQFNAAMPQLSEAFTLWETARKVLTEGCVLLGMSPDTLAIEINGSSVSIAGEVRTLIARLTEVKRCLGAHDWCGLSDVLAYDLKAAAALWRTMLGALADKLPELR